MSRQTWTVLRFLLATTALTALGSFDASAQIVTDGTLHTGSPITLSNGTQAQVDIAAEIGQVRGTNLFHSFRTFSINAGQTATFQPPITPTTLNNVLSRVTGGSASTIDGALQSKVGSANFWFINPNGVVFGPNAKLDVPASFYVSTANEVRFGDGAAFSATNPSASTLTVATPEAFGFLGGTPRDISIEPNKHTYDYPTLKLQSGSTLTMAAGNITNTWGDLRAPEGRINLVTVGGAAEVRAATGETAAPLAGTITQDYAWAIAQGNGGGSVHYRAGTIKLINESWVDAGNTGTADSTGRIWFDANDITISGGSRITANTSGGRGSDIAIKATGRVTVSDDSSQILTSSSGPGRAGDITFEVTESDFFGGGYLESASSGAGAGGNITINATARLALADASAIRASTSSDGDAGSITVNTGALTLSDGSFFRSVTSGAGSGGEIRFTLTSAEILSGSDITSYTTGTGRAGNIELRGRTDGAAELVEISGNGSGLFAGSYGSSASASAGNIHVKAEELRIGDRGIISSQTTGPGRAGTITLDIDDKLTLSAGGMISASTASSGTGGNIDINAETAAVDISGYTYTGGKLYHSAVRSMTFGTGNAGDIAIDARTLTIDSGGVRSSYAGTPSIEGDYTSGIVGDTRSTGAKAGASGNISVAADHLTVKDDGMIASRTFGTGAGGTITVNVGRAEFTGGGQINVASRRQSTGNGGDIDLTAGDLLTISGGSSTTGWRSGLFASTENQTGAGPGGNITVRARRVAIDDSGLIAVSTNGGGKSGNIRVIDVDSLSLSTLGKITTTSGGAGNAGDIQVNVANATFRSGGQITASAGENSTGAGGNISLTASGAVDISGYQNEYHSGLKADALSTAANGGSAGTIAVTADRLSISDAGTISSSTVGRGNAGNINVSVRTATLDTGGAIGTVSEGTGAGGNIDAVARETLTIRGGTIVGTEFQRSGFFANAQGNSVDAGNAGDVRVTSGILTLQDRGIITSSSTADGGGGDAGNIWVAFKDADLTTTGLITTGTEGTGKAGNIRVTGTGTLTLAGGSLMSVTSGAPGRAGDGGEIAVNVGRLVLREEGIIATSTLGGGNAGSIGITAGGVEIAGGSVVSAETWGSGRGGNVRLDVAGDLDITGRSSAGVTSGLFATTSGQGGANAGGAITVNAGTVRVGDHGEISSETLGTGDGGQVSVTARSVTVSGGGKLAADVNDPGTGLGGTVTVTGTEDVTVTGADSAISSDNAGPRAGGSVRVVAPAVTITADGVISARATGGGVGGSVSVSGQKIAITDGGQVTAEATGTGDSGDIQVEASERLDLTNGAITTSAAKSGGGTIDIRVIDTIRLNNSQIKTAVQGLTGNAGNIFIDPRFMIIENGSVISASAIGGNGGNITIRVGNLIADWTSKITASSQLGVSGQIALSAPVTDVSGGLVVLTNDFLDAAAQLADRCSARGLGGGSSLTGVGRGGLPEGPEVPLPGFIIDEESLNLGASGTSDAGAAAGAKPSVQLVPVQLGLSCQA